MYVCTCTCACLCRRDQGNWSTSFLNLGNISGVSTAAESFKVAGLIELCLHAALKKLQCRVLANEDTNILLVTTFEGVL